jgi:hypothetical protein
MLLLIFATSILRRKSFPSFQFCVIVPPERLRPSEGALGSLLNH